MKYLLGYLEGVEGAPSLSDPDFQQLLLDVQAGKAADLADAQTQAKSSDAWYDSLEKIVNELKSSPESAAFHKPVSKRDAPDYANFITRPMDLSTVLRNVRTHKYKNKADFAADLDLIWENCLLYNTVEQKANHHLEFLAERTERGANPLLPLLTGSAGSPASTRHLSASHALAQPSPLRAESAAPPDDEDAAGESDDGGEGQSVAGQRAGHGPATDSSGPNGRATPDVGGGRDDLAPGDAAALKASGGRREPPFRPKLPTSLDTASALIRTPLSMTHYLPVSLHAGPSFSDKGKAKEVLYGAAPPPWYPAVDDDDARLEGAWYTAMQRDDAFVAGLPAVPAMLPGPASRRRRIRRRVDPPSAAAGGTATTPPPLEPSRPVSLERIVHRAADKLADARRFTGQIQEWQRIDAEGGILPAPDLGPPEAEAVHSVRRATAGLLAHAGFEGANEIALDMFTRVAVNHLRDLGRTLRLLTDTFSRDMDAEEIVLHALHETGQVQPADLEAHIKDDIERDSAKIAEMERKVRAAYKDVISGPVIGDDMLLGADGQMLQHGEFAEDLGEDFLGLRELGLDKEFGLASLSVPRSLFFGRRARGGPEAVTGAKDEVPDYAPPPPFVPLNSATIPLHVPALLHAFFASRVEAGLGLADDAAFDPPHAQIGPLGQIIVKKEAPPPKKVKKDEPPVEKKKAPKKVPWVEGDRLCQVQPCTGRSCVSVPGVGKGNWVRPPKEERDRRAAEKRALLERQRAAASQDGPEEKEEDAEGEDE